MNDRKERQANEMFLYFSEWAKREILQMKQHDDLGDKMKRKDRVSCAYLRLCELNNMIRNNSTLDKKKELELISIVLSEILELVR